MTLHNKTKINQLLQSWPKGTVASAHWLEQEGVSRQLLNHYQKSNWIEAIGNGAFKRSGDMVDWKGGLYAIQNHTKLPIHAGGLTAIILQGSGHYIRYKENIQLFGNSNTKSPLPTWFRNYTWEDNVCLYRTKLLPDELSLKKYDDKNFSITISSLERAMLECLYLAPNHIDLVECYHIMEGLAGLHPETVQELLTKCTSIKAKRLFLYMANKANHAWLEYIDLKHINLGKGKRSIVTQGFYDKKHQITLPKELETL